jgi:hypothetical protein
MAPRKPNDDLSTLSASQLEAEHAVLDLELKREQVAEMRAAREEREALREKRRMERERLVNDIKKSDQDRERRQSRCRHKKGGRNNDFSKGNSSNYSVVTNTYPTGIVEIRCTRCAQVANRPDKNYRRELAKQFPKAEDFKQAWENNVALWEKFKDFTTDNEPSGGQIFLVEGTAAA